VVSCVLTIRKTELIYRSELGRVCRGLTDLIIEGCGHVYNPVILTWQYKTMKLAAVLLSETPV
jgi:hypothetical protein